MNARREIQIPFAGWYESLWDAELDNTAERDCEYLAEEVFKGRDESDIAEALHWCARWHVAHLQLTREYAEAFAHKLDTEAGWKMRLQFSEMDSPREYNFTTDKVWMRVPRATVRRLMAETNDGDLSHVATERHTSYSGFISFYSPDWRTWGALDKWDLNQVSTLLLAWMRSRELDADEIEESIREDFSGNGYFDDALSNCYTVAELEAELNKKENSHV